MRMAGIVLIVLSAGTMGFRIAHSLRKRCRLLRQLLSALQLLKQEIGCCATPLPQAFALMAVSSDGSLEKLFSAMAREMDKNRWTTPLAAMRKALTLVPELPEGDPAAQILLELAARLGKYDLESQLQGIDLAALRLGEELGRAEQERSTKSKTYQTLGICTGLAVAILLM